MNQSKILIIIAIMVIAAIAGYYAYTQYNTLKTQEYLKTSQDFKYNATDYFKEAVSYEDSGDYSNAIMTYKKSNEQISQALNFNNQALNYATGVYREYLDNDILMLEKTSKLIEYKIYINQYNNNSLNPGQEKVNPTVLTPYIDNLVKEVANFKTIEDQIINNHPEEFKFLNQ